MTLQLAPSTSSEPTPQPVPLGSITPRLWTRPLRPLTPETSYGFRVIWFAAFILREPLDPWQQWAVIHLGELLPNGRPRFRQVLLLVARQNGKTHLCKVLALYWLFVERQAMVFGTSTNLEQAKESWEHAVETAQKTPALSDRVSSVRIGNGQQVLSTTDRCRYKIGAADRKGGRGKTIRRAIGDELREQHTWEAYNAVTFATNAVADAQIVYITNQGDARSVVLAALRRSALAGDDPGLGILEWSAPPGAAVTDPAAWAAANPQLGRRMDPAVLAGPAARVTKPDADPAELAGFKTEALCMSVDRLDPAIDPAAWQACLDVGDLDEHRTMLAACIDLNPAGTHATLAVAAVLGDDRVRVETVHEWTGPNAAMAMERELPGWVLAVKPKVLGWFPAGPAAAVASKVADRRKEGVYSWPPRGVKVAEIRGETTAVCMALGKEVSAKTLAHSGQEMLDTQVSKAEKAKRGDAWVFTRAGGGNVDAVYAIAGAAQLARTLPKTRKISRKTRAAP
ncbi:terminase [Micromonospora chokoriensis]|uniref:terminase n=1 Tax=Micromonospora chokoriensis TaxID=356851 RepID=UPI001E524FC7|nr:terminase [Micromonospora chokoriensis]